MNILDEMAEAITGGGCDVCANYGRACSLCGDEARAAAAVVARRLQEAMAVDRAGDYWLGRNMVHAIIAELEGKQ